MCSDLGKQHKKHLMELQNALSLIEINFENHNDCDNIYVLINISKLILAKLGMLTKRIMKVNACERFVLKEGKWERKFKIQLNALRKILKVYDS
jgi:hypothetical protein